MSSSGSFRMPARRISSLSKLRVSVETIERLVRTPAPVATRRFEPLAWQTLVTVHDRKGRTCTTCTFSAGSATCMGCGGRGQIVLRETRRGDEWIRCHGCNGTGRVVCSRCEGSLTVYPSTVRTFQHAVDELEHVFSSSVHPVLHEEISSRLLGLDELPSELAFDLERPMPRAAASYRSGPADEVPRLFGVEVAQSLGEARAVLGRLSAGREVIDRAVQTHAVPICALRYDRTHVALVAMGAGRMLAVRADETD